MSTYYLPISADTGFSALRMKFVCVVVVVVVVADSFFVCNLCIMMMELMMRSYFSLMMRQLRPLRPLRNRCCSGGLTRSLYKMSINQKHRRGSGIPHSKMKRRVALRYAIKRCVNIISFFSSRPPQHVS